MPIEVRQVMGHVAIAVRMDARFADIVAAMKRFAVGAVTVIDLDRRPVGVVSEDDLLLKETDPDRRAAGVFESHRQRVEHRKAAGVTAAELMTAPAIKVTPGTSVRDAAHLMHEKRIKQLPVIDPVTGRIVGTVHQRDLLRVFDRQAGELREEVESVARDKVGLDPGTLSIDISGGVVTLGGALESVRKIAELIHAVRCLDGVVDVVSTLAAPRVPEGEARVIPPTY